MEHKNVKPQSLFPWLGQSLLDLIVKFGKWLLDTIWIFVKAFINIFVSAYKIILKVALKIYNWFKNWITTFIKGNWKTRLSYLVMGSSHLFNGQIVKGLIFLVLQAVFLLFMFLPKIGRASCRERV